jgi:hypothetical protein
MFIFLFIFISEKKKTRAESVDCTPPDYIMPCSKERPLLALQPMAKEQKGPQCIKVSHLILILTHTILT